MHSNDNRSSRMDTDTSLPVIGQQDRKTWLQRFRLKLTSPVYREKFYYMIGLCLSYFFSGWVVGLKGPSFLDLQQITGVGTRKGAAFFTAAAVGAAVGNLVGGALYDRYNRHIVLFCSSFLYGVTCAVIPWCSIYWTMVLMFLIHELVEGAARSGTNVEIVKEWGNEGKPFMQALHFSFSLGGTLSPFLLDPFLAEEIPNQNTTPTVVNSITPTTTIAKVNVSTSPAPTRESRIHYAFLIVGVLACLSSFVFLIKYCHDKQRGEDDVMRNESEKGEEKEKREKVEEAHKEEREKEKEKKKAEEPHRNEREKEKREKVEEPHRKERSLPLRLSILIILLFGLFYFFLDEVEDTSPSFLATFVVKQLGWTKVYGGRLSSAFWASYTTGRGFGIVIINFLSHVQLFSLCCIVLCLGQVALLLSGIYHFGTGIWISIVTIGLSISVVFPASLTWTEKKLMQLSGKLMGVIYVALALGGLANPQIIGVTMEMFSPLWFSYVLCAESVLFSIIFILLVTFVRKVLSQYKEEPDAEPEIEITKF